MSELFAHSESLRKNYQRTVNHCEEINKARTSPHKKILKTLKSGPQNGIIEEMFVFFKKSHDTVPLSRQYIFDSGQLGWNLGPTDLKTSIVPMYYDCLVLSNST